MFLGLPTVALRTRLLLVFLLCLAGAAHAQSQSRNLAPGFTALPKGAVVLLAPLDVELFSVSAGGVPEPRADWTTAALKHMKTALEQHKAKLGVRTAEIDEATADEFAELLSLHAAVSRAISQHHFNSALALPTKEGKLDWSFGDAFQPLQKKAGARYALFTFVRDSYASAERIAAMAVMALLGVGLTGGVQVGYASLVDLESGRVLWFNQLARASGDLREPDKAAESVVALLQGFPSAAP
jgi:hypothetical protein